jgi:hypothetical protein
LFPLLLFLLIVRTAGLYWLLDWLGFHGEEKASGGRTERADGLRFSRRSNQHLSLDIAVAVDEVVQAMQDILGRFDNR